MFRDFIGNQRVTAWLRRAVALDQLSHAYLITGPDQIGKRTLALALAQAVQCTSRLPDGDACGACASCRKLAHGSHPDVLVLALPKDKQHYAIEQMRELAEAAALAPTEGRFRIFIVPDAEKLTLPAMQSSLKLLEEPPPTARIILTATTADLVLPTILSRCQEIALAPVVPDELAAALRARAEVDAPIAQATALLSGGCPGWAIEALEHPEEVAERRALLHDLAALSQASLAERIAAAGRLAPDREQARQVIELWLPWWRDVLLVAHGAAAIARYADDLPLIERQAQACGPEAAARFVRAQLRALEELEQNASPRLVFEVMLQDLPQA
jgi:DNA polymerase-3 subunit delta'